MKYKPASLKPVRWWDWPAAFFLAAALSATATRLITTKWTNELGLVQTVTILGVIAGLALGQSAFSPSVARIFALIYGGFVVVWQVGLTLGKGILWHERLISMGNRLLIILEQLARQKPVSDNLLFHLLMASLFWAISLYAGYSLTRHANAWVAILPGGLALVIIHTFDALIPQRAWYLAGYIFLGLLVVARLHFLRQQARWKQNGTYLPPFAGLDSIRLGLLVTAILVFFAWTAPALASGFDPLEQAWQRVTLPWVTLRNRFSTAFSSLRSSVGLITDFYGDNLPLGRGNPLTDTIVLTVQTPSNVPAGVRYYWRSRVYDFYDESWINTLPVTQSISPDQFDLVFPEYEGRSSAEFIFKTNFPIQNLPTPAQPTWLSRPAEAQLAVNADGTVDLGFLKATPYLRPGEIYHTRASLSSATKKQLREAGSEYPFWVTARYLQLPESITLRTRRLATAITAGLDNPYDKVQAITDYLRANLSYAETVPVPPSGQEPIDWILFDHRQAFCNYYASAEVILLRSLGIPARLAVGYAQGERRSLEQRDIVPAIRPGENIPREYSIGDLYTVRHRDAHAWPEVYFPGLGWVEFEPTASQSPILRPEGIAIENEAADPSAADTGADPSQDQRQSPDGPNEVDLAALAGTAFEIPLLVWALVAALAIVFLLILARWYRRKRGLPPLPVQLEAGLDRIGLQPPPFLRRWARQASLSPMARAYQELNRALSRLGKPPKATDTPAERGLNLVEMIPSAAVSTGELLTEYQLDIYGGQGGDILVAQRAGREIRKQSLLARLQRLLRRFQEPPKSERPPIRSADFGR